MSCLNCGAELPVGAMFCGECGRAASRPAELISCASCGSRMTRSDIFCGECGRVARSAAIGPLDTGAQPTVRTESAQPEALSTEALRAEVRRTEPARTEALSTEVLRGDSPPRRPAPEQPGVAIDLSSLPHHGQPLLPVEELVLPSTEIALDGPDALMGSREQATAASSALAPGEETRIVRALRGSTRPTVPRFVLQFSTGESVTVAGSGLIGRNPTAEPGEYFDNLVRILDLTRSVSKTHLEFGCEQGEFWLSDRYSGNGTILRPPERTASRAEPGKRYRVTRGSRIDLGEQFFVVS